MSHIRVYPYHWSTSDDWTHILLYGRLENHHSVSIRLPFKPYLTLRYPTPPSPEFHSYLLQSTPVLQITPLDSLSFRFFFRSAHDYSSFLSFFPYPCHIIDSEVPPIDKFLVSSNIYPSSWVQVSHLTSSPLTICDLNYSATKIKSLTSNLLSPHLVMGYLELISPDGPSFPGFRLHPISEIRVFIDLEEPPLRKTGIPSSQIRSERSLQDPLIPQLKSLKADRWVVFGSQDAIWLRQQLGPDQCVISLEDLFHRLYPPHLQITIDNVSSLILSSPPLKSHCQTLKELWIRAHLEEELSKISNFWMCPANDSLSHPELLMDHLYSLLSSPETHQRRTHSIPGSPYLQPGLYLNVHVYSLSELYLIQIKDPLVDYFRGSYLGHLLFDYLGHSTNEIRSSVMAWKPIWIDQTSVALTAPHPGLPLLDRLPLVLIRNGDRVILTEGGSLHRLGYGLLACPPFPLVDRYLQLLIDHVIRTCQRLMNFPNLETSLNDFLCQRKIYREDLTGPDPDSLILQVRECGLEIPSTGRMIPYLQTLDGPLIYTGTQKVDLNRIQIDWYSNILSQIFGSDDQK